MKKILKNIYILLNLIISFIKNEGKGVPVLLYHRVLDNPEGSPIAAIKKDYFIKQIQYLYRKGYKTIKIEDFIQYLRGEKKIENKSIIITFDDGFFDNYDAIKIASQYGFSVVLFIATEFCGKEFCMVPFNDVNGVKINMIEDICKPIKFLSVDELADLCKLGTEIYPHTNSHVNLQTASQEIIEKEIMISHKFFIEEFNSIPKIFAYPYGKFSEKSIDVLKRNNYISAFGVHDGINSVGDDLFNLKRHNVGNTSSLIYFRLLLTQQYVNYKKHGRILSKYI